MLDDAALDRLVAEINPEPDEPVDSDEAWTRLLASDCARRGLGDWHLPRRRVLVPALAVCAAIAAFALLNSLPSGGADSVATAYAKAITHGEQVLGNRTGPILYVEMVSTATGPGFGTRHFVDQSWQGRNAFRYSAIASGPGTSNAITDVAILGGIGAYYVPATHTLHVNRQPDSGTQTGLSGLSGFEPASDPLRTALQAVLNAKADHGSAGAVSIAGVFRQLSRLPGAQVTQKNGLVTITVADERFYTQAVAKSGSLAPVSITMTHPDRTQHAGVDVTRIHFTHYTYLPAAAGAEQIDLLDVYPGAKIITTHRAFLTVP